MTARILLRRLLVPVLALVVLTLAAPSSASAADSNSVVSRTGATLTSSGTCGGSTFNFTVSSAGFEYLRIDTAGPSGYRYGTWTAQNQNARWRYQLPYYYQATTYYVVGLDWNPYTRGWETYYVTTSFLQVPALDYTTWSC